MPPDAPHHRHDATGLWREDAGAQRREVRVTLGDATLIISDLNEAALTHWSLPAVARVNAGRYPALYAPAEASDEQLEISDKDMIAAIEARRAEIERTRPHPGRLRHWIGIGLAATALSAAVVWLPDALTRQTAAMLPEASRAEIGQSLLLEMSRIAGRPCSTPAGQAALGALTTRVLGPQARQVIVLPSGVPDTIALPGGLLVVQAELVEDYDTPAVLAGFMIVETLRRAETDPMFALLEGSGLRATVQLLTTGQLPQDALHEHAARLLITSRTPVDADTALPRFAAAQVASSPYAYALDVSGETTLALIEADPMRTRAPEPLLTDAQWLSLQAMCSD